MNAGLKSNSISPGEISSAEDARRVCADVIMEWPEDSAFDTSSVLKSHPELRSHKSVVVDPAFEEYTRRRELGEDLTPTEFASRFPTIQKSLVQQLQVCDFLFDNSLVPPTLAETVWPEAGSTFLNFKLLAEIGRGSFSRVFLAEETDLGDRQVVSEELTRRAFWGGLSTTASCRSTRPTLMSRRDCRRSACRMWDAQR